MLGVVTAFTVAHTSATAKSIFAQEDARPKTTLDEIIKAHRTLETEPDDYHADQKKLRTHINQTMGEYRTIAESMDKSHDAIIEQKKQLKDAYDTWDKISQTLQRKSDVTTLGKDALATSRGSRSSSTRRRSCRRHSLPARMR